MPTDIVNSTLTSASDEGTPGPDNSNAYTAKKQQQSPETSPDRRKLYEEFRSRIDSCKIYRRKLVQNWIYSIDYRRGKPFASQTDEDRIAINLDWSLTKAKQAALFSQVPQIRIDHPPQSQAAGPWLHAYEQRINDTLGTAGIEAAMDETLSDVINAAGIGAILVAHESLTDTVQIPSIDPSTLQPNPDGSPATTMPDGTPIPMTSMPRVMDHRYLISRISPADLLWPINFIGSDFDAAPWIGRSGRMSWARAVSKFGLTEADRDGILGEDRNMLDRLTHDIDKDKTIADDMVGFDEIFYKEAEYDPQANSFVAIHHLVFVQGKDIPVVDEPWKGQQIDQNDPQGNTIIGVQRFPIRVLTLTYVTDETIPPSDSAVGRPQINELNKSRTQMVLQRERSLPIRWFNVDRVDPAIQQSLMRGTWQAMIPIQGTGQNVIGAVDRSPMPQENFKFDEVIKGDLAELWQLGPNTPGNAPETQQVQEIASPQTRIGRERAKVGKFFCTIAEVLGGLICLYEDPNSFGQQFDPTIAKTLNYSILADSTVLVDSNQRLKRLIDLLDIAAKSGWIDIAPILKEIVELSGLDPNAVVKPPMPKPPVEPNISLRLTGVEDMLNPLTLAFLIKSGQAPPPELIEQAKQLIQQAVAPPPGMQMQPGQPAPGGAPMLPGSVPPGAGGPPPQPPPQVPNPPPPAIGEAHKQWGLMPSIGKRTEGEGGNQ